MIRPERIGHAVIKVRDLDRSRKFYTEVLGMQIMKDVSEIRAVFLANHGRDHHELALFEIGSEAEAPNPKAVGLAHIAFRLGSQEELEAAYHELKDKGVPSTSLSTTASPGASISRTRTATSSKSTAITTPPNMSSTPTPIWGWRSSSTPRRTRGCAT